MAKNGKTVSGKQRYISKICARNSLVTVKTLPIPEGVTLQEMARIPLTKYTKHYYIDSERITSVIGSKLGLGAYPGQSETTIPLNLVEDIVDAAGTAVQGAVAHFGLKA